MAEYGKLSFDVAFNPSTAFPLDARSYFDSYEAAEAAAKKAAEVGSSSSVYYFGETLSVVENDVATFYIIQPDGSLKQVGSDDGPVKVEINENHFKYTDDNKLELLGATKATKGQVLAMDASGALAWVTPVDAYSKTETDSAISSAVANSAHLKRKIVDSVDEINKNAEDAFQYIYMVPKLSALEGDHYDEYMVIEVAETRFVEKVGDWAIDLTGYAKTSDLDKYVEKVDGSRLLTSAEADKITESEKNVVNSVSSDFSISDNRELSLNDIDISKITDLQSKLDSKVDAQEGYTLLSPTDQTKLSKLVIGDDGSVGVSGTINASNVKELDQWIKTNRNDVNGLLSEANETKLEALFDEVNESEFEIAPIGDEGDTVQQLNLVAVPQRKVTGLEDALNNKADKTVVDNLVTTVGNSDEGLVHDVKNVANDLNTFIKETYKTKMDAIDADISDLKDALIWKDLAISE